MKIQDIIVLPVDDGIINKTVNNAIKKYDYTINNLSYSRTPVEQLDNIYMGDLAKNALVAYFRNQRIVVEDYDEIRTDNFQDHDPGWDFKLGKHKLRCEVKSLIPPNNESDSDIIAKRDIKVIASHDKHQETVIPAERLDCELHFQIYFRAVTYKKGYDDFKKLLNDLKQNPAIIHQIINSSKYNKPLFFGVAAKKEIINYAKNLGTWTFSWTSALYWCCPISKAHNLQELINALKK